MICHPPSRGATQEGIATAPIESPYLTRQEAAAIARVHIGTVDRARARGELRSGGTPGCVRIRREWIDAWLEHRDETWLKRRDR